MPFTVEQFMEVFKNYNTTVFPAQLILYLIGIAAIYFAVKKSFWSNKIITIILSLLWLWMGIVYHLIFFTTINKAAWLFGALYILEAGMLMFFSFSDDKLSFKFHPDIYGLTGLFLILFAMIIYPVIGYFVGHIYPAAPGFGLPCPTTIFTFGLLLWTDKKCPVIILVIPFLWSLLGFSAAVSLGIYEDIGLLVAGLIATSMILIRNKKYTMIST
jgi:hypothetical protein